MTDKARGSDNIVERFLEIASGVYAKVVTLGIPLSGGFEPFYCLDADENVDATQEIKSSEGVLNGVFAYNTASSERWVVFYNAEHGDVTVGTTDIREKFPIPPDSAGFIIPPSIRGTPYDTAISFAVVTGRADDDNTGPGDDEVFIAAWFK